VLIAKGWFSEISSPMRRGLRPNFNTPVAATIPGSKKFPDAKGIETMKVPSCGLLFAGFEEVPRCEGDARRIDNLKFVIAKI
jgi:hypothetical protein